ncbi:MAG: sodium:solute symporter [Flavipsychrobacter sp.]|nr:sodium:solute symporter [Flavipsychrobacter sp.]
MSTPDWLILFATLLGIIIYGVYKGRKQDGVNSYLLADRQMPWYVVLLGVMATQASAITFLSAPGQAYTDGMRFVQYYFGLPIAMVVISVTFIPIFRRLNVYTAYEYLEQRFDRRTRLLTSVLFLLSRGLSTGISIYAPAIIISSIFGWNIYLANIVTGGLLLIYTFTGGAKAVAHTQKLQFLIILASMGIAGYLVVQRMPTGVGLADALFIAGKSGKLNVITTDFNWQDKYNIWSGIIGGFFLALSYFGTDQSQVGRYLTGKDDRESKLGLLMNGIVKIPMQFARLLRGALLFSFYSFQSAPLNFNSTAYSKLQKSDARYADSVATAYTKLQEQKQQSVNTITILRKNQFTAEIAPEVKELQSTLGKIDILRDSVHNKIHQRFGGDKDDSNYIFLHFVINNLPTGLIGLLLAVIILASWGSISAALNSLASSSMMDIQLLGRKEPPSDKKQLWLGRMHTLLWGLFCIGVAMFAAQLGSLIEAVNVLGSLFYGTILGIFLVAFYLKRIDGTSVFIAAAATEVCVIAIYLANVVSFLWLNVVGALLVVLFSLLIKPLLRRA